MIEVLIPEQHYEFFDDVTETFLPPIDIPETKLQLEHSLISIKKWEEKWHKPFLGTSEKTYEELSDYIRCMTVNRGVDQKIYKCLPQEAIDKVVAYIKDPMTATWFSGESFEGQSSSSEVITAEIIYYWMVALNIPVEFQKWHLNQLLTLIKVCNVKNKPPKKMDKRTAARKRAELNRKRREMYKSKG